MADDARDAPASSSDPEATYRDEAWLRRRYWEDGLSTVEIADLVGVDSSTVLRWMQRHEVERRSQEPSTEAIELRRWTILRLADGLSTGERADLREWQGTLVSRLDRLEAEETRELKRFAADRAWDPEDAADRIDARAEFRRTELGESFRDSERRLIASLADGYEAALQNRFEAPEAEPKKDRITFLKTVFGIDCRDRAVMAAADASRRYVKEFTAVSDVDVDDAALHGKQYDREQHEAGEPATVLRRSRPGRDGPSSSTRSEVFERDGSECLRCGSTEDLELHHVTPRSLGGDHEPDNLATLCSACHDDARLHLTLSGEEVPAYPLDSFDAWVDGTLDVCGAITADGTPCEHTAGSCPHHD